jgi:hypothetical protein
MRYGKNRILLLRSSLDIQSLVQGKQATRNVPHKRYYRITVNLPDFGLNPEIFRGGRRAGEEELLINAQ